LIAPRGVYATDNPDNFHSMFPVSGSDQAMPT
jgi:hypothetical protein